MPALDLEYWELVKAGRTGPRPPIGFPGITHALVSVQPMSGPRGTVFYPTYQKDGRARGGS
jgi:hypothetical protein